jgi:predicted transcriptional regulator
MTAGAVLAVYISWETVKVIGLPDLLHEVLFGRKKHEDQKRRDEDASDHYEQCRTCKKCQDDQVKYLQKISDTAIRIETSIQVRGK